MSKHQPTCSILQLSQQALALKQQDDLVNSCPDICLGGVNNQIRVLGVLVWVVDTSEALDLTSTCLGIDTAPVRLLSVLERCSNVNKEERAVALDSLTSRSAGSLEWRNGRSDSGRTCLGELGSNESNAGNVLVAVFSREAELG